MNIDLNHSNLSDEKLTVQNLDMNPIDNYFNFIGFDFQEKITCGYNMH